MCRSKTSGKPILTICPMRSATSSTRSVIITKSLVPRISLACCASCTLMPPSSLTLELLGREHSNCTSGAQSTVGPTLKSPGNSAFGLFVRRMGRFNGSALFDQLDSDRKAGFGRVVINLLHRRFQDLAAEILPPQQLPCWHFQPVPQLLHRRCEFRYGFVGSGFQEFVERHRIFARQFDHEMRAQASKTAWVFEYGDQQTRKLKAQESCFMGISAYLSAKDCRYPIITGISFRVAPFDNRLCQPCR